MKKEIFLISLILMFMYSCSKLPTVQVNNTDISNSEKNSWSIIINEGLDKKIPIPDEINNSEKNIDKLEKEFYNKKTYFYQDITVYQDDITKWIDEFINNIWIINFEAYLSDDWYIKKKISIEGDRTDIYYSFYIKKDKLYWVRKNRNDYNHPKWEDNSKIESEKHEDCYISLNNCSKDMLFLYDYIQKLKIDK